VANALSRRPAACSLMEILANWKSHLLVEYSKNKFVCEVMDGQIQDDRYKVIDDVIFYKVRVYLVLDSGLKKKIPTVVHHSPLASHQGFLKTYRQIRERFSWKGLKQDVMRHVNECVTCQQNKSEHALPTGYFSHSQFQSRNGRVYRWTSSQAYPRSRIRTVSM
jgi:hypothetical protein